MKRLLSFLLLFFLASPAALADQPRLVVVISLDQFRYDYLVRFGPSFGPGGLRLLLERGTSFTHATFKHSQTNTGPGHAVLLSGAYGNSNGIIANTWYDKAAGHAVYCVEDKNVRLLAGTGTGSSPANFVGSTLGDELRLQSGFRSKVIAVSHKDRAAILMAGRLANAAYWMRDSAFTTSSYYCDTLPAWVTAFNASGVINRYFGSVWEHALPPNAYAGLGPDDAPWEDGADGLGVAFPHRITGSDPQHITRSYYTALIRSPFGSDALLRFAEAAVQGEQLGSRGVTDLLCISFSGTDYVGHAFGPLSHEVFDMAVRMDRTLAALFAFLDRAIGLDRCVIALSADHGVGPAPEALLAHAPGTRVGRLPGSVITQLANEALRVRFAALPPRGDLVAASQSFNLYLDGPLLTRAGVDTSDAAEVVAAALNRHPAVALALSARRLREGNHPSPLAMKMRRSFFEGRSGDVVYALKPYWYEDDDHTGASHGTPWEYDAHVPLLLFGKGIRPGAYASEASPVDLAPTLAALLGVEFTAGSDGAVLEQALVQPVPPAAR